MRPVLVIAAMLLAGPALGQPRPPAPPTKPPTVLTPIAPLSGGGFTPIKPLTPGASLRGLPAVSDTRATCRSTCATVRITCGAEDEGCTERWTQCVAGCGR